MIIEKKIKNYTVFVKKDGEKYIEIFKDFLSYNHQVIKVFRNIEDTKVGNDSNLLIVFYVQ
ncbi:TPA: hypothetical protein H5D27_004802, partial [Salmonella enterica]|nr:hypothetical protein [Salmonella enterica]